MGTAREVFVPDIGDFKNVDVIEVLVKRGDAVQPEQSLITVESDKATMEIPSPAAGDGISIVALSDSTVISDCSGCTASPRLTSTSITSTFLKSPMSGTKTSLAVPILAQFVIWGAGAGQPSRRPAPAWSDSHWIGFFRIDPVFLDCVGNDLGFDLALVGERLERRDCYEVTIHFEEVTQLGAGIRAAVSIGAEHPVDAVSGDERSNLVGKTLDVVGSSDHGTFTLLQALGRVRDPGLHFRMQRVPTLDR